MNQIWDSDNQKHHQEDNNYWRWIQNKSTGYQTGFSTILLFPSTQSSRRIFYQYTHGPIIAKLRVDLDHLFPLVIRQLLTKQSGLWYTTRPQFQSETTHVFVGIDVPSQFNFVILLFHLTKLNVRIDFEFGGFFSLITNQLLFYQRIYRKTFVILRTGAFGALPRSGSTFGSTNRGQPERNRPQ